MAQSGMQRLARELHALQAGTAVVSREKFLSLLQRKVWEVYRGHGWPEGQRDLALTLCRVLVFNDVEMRTGLLPRNFTFVAVTFKRLCIENNMQGLPGQLCDWYQE